MKTPLIYLISLLLTSCVLTPSRPMTQTSQGATSNSKAAASSSAVKYRAVLLPIQDKTGLVPSEVTQELSQKFRRQLELESDLVLIDAAQAKLPLEAKKLNADWFKIAQKMGVMLVVEPSILSMEVKGKTDPVGVIRRSQTELNLKVQLKLHQTRSQSLLMDRIKTNLVEDSRIRVGPGSSEQLIVQNPEVVAQRLSESFSDYLPDLQGVIRQLTWEGRIALIQGDRVYLNVGQLTGIKPGDLLKVSDLGDEVYDPQSGRFIGRSPGRVKGVIEVISFFGEDGSIAVMNSGSGFRENDRVELHW